VVGATEATVVDVGVDVVVEVPVSLVLTLQLLVETAGDFDAFPGSLQGDFFRRLSFEYGRDIPHRASKEGMRGRYGDRLTIFFLYFRHSCD
jgi:hypothetical protein